MQEIYLAQLMHTQQSIGHKLFWMERACEAPLESVKPARKSAAEATQPRAGPAAATSRWALRVLMRLLNWVTAPNRPIWPLGTNRGTPSFT